METFTAAPHHDVLVLLIQVPVLLLVARLLAEGAQRLGQPAVVGEILAGILLGPSLLSGLFPVVGQWIVPQSEVAGFLLETVALLGALFLLLLTGLETDLGLIRRHARLSIGASLGGIVVPFATGYALGQWLPGYLLVDERQRLVFSLFVATAMSISAIPVIAKVLMDLKLMRRDIGQAIIAAGMTDDAMGWMLLSVVLGLAASGEIQAGTVAWSVGKVVGFMIVSFTVGRWLVRRSIDFVQDKAVSSTRMLTLAVLLTFAWGALTQALNLEAVFGAFVMGILLAQMPRLPNEVRHDLERFGLGVFAPIFFAVAGLKVNALALLEPRLIVVTLVVIAVASVGKVLGGYAGARWIGRTGHWEALSFGAGMNARGAMEIIIASIGLSLGILTQDMFSIIVVMALATSLMAPPALRWTLRRVRPSQEEEQRLKREELEQGSLVAHVRRVLIPVRCRSEERRALLTLEAHLVQQLGTRGSLAITLLNVTHPDSKDDSMAFLDRLGEQFPGVELTKKVVHGKDPTGAILDEAQKDYDLLILGAPEGTGGERELFTARIDEVLRLAPCPTMVVKGRVSRYNWPPRRILVPTSSSIGARNAADLGFALADGNTEVLLLNVVEQSGEGIYQMNPSEAALQRQLTAAEAIVGKMRVLGESRGVRTLTKVQVDREPVSEILRLVQQDGVDLVVVGTSVGVASDHLFLGPRVERVLEHASCPVVLINAA